MSLRVCYVECDVHLASVCVLCCRTAGQCLKGFSIQITHAFVVYRTFICGIRLACCCLGDISKHTAVFYTVCWKQIFLGFTDCQESSSVNRCANFAWNLYLILFTQLRRALSLSLSALLRTLYQHKQRQRIQPPKMYSVCYQTIDLLKLNIRSYLDTIVLLLRYILNK